MTHFAALSAPDGKDPVPDLQGALRQEYLDNRGDAERRSIRIGIWAALVVYLVFSITDLLLIPDVAAYTIASRTGISILVISYFEFQYRAGAPLARLDLICAAGFVLSYVAWLCPALMTTHTEIFSYYMIFGAIFLMAVNLFFSFQFLLAIIASSIVLAIFFIALFLFPADNAYRLALGTFYVSCFAFTSYVNWKLNMERYNVFLNAREARNQQREADERGKALLRLSRTDPLTGLENRRAVDERLRDHWVDWQKQGIEFAVLLVDVDYFKRFNDFYGHQEGDQCLILVAGALHHMLKDQDAAVGRYGGEEFIVIVESRSKEQVAELAESIRSTIENLGLKHQHRRDGTSVVTVSVGAALTRSQVGARLERIIHEADRALYVAKANGRNCTRLFDPGDPQSSDESENIAALLKTAIEQNLISLVYQPIQDVATGKVTAAEALMRLKTPDGINVPPSLFIPVAERTGMIVALGRWAIGTVCRELLAEGRVGVASVNVSPIQLKTPGFAASVAAILGETGISGSRLAFEITEGLDMEVHADILHCISDLKLLGVQIWLDDFGTGFAGLSWLRLIDFDTVKIDRSFLHDANRQKGKAMLRDIVELVRNRGNSILMEGVETSEHVALMHELHINLVQGYYIGRPVQAGRFSTAKIERSAVPVLRTA